MRVLLAGGVSLAVLGGLLGGVSDPARARAAAASAPVGCVPSHLNVSAALAGSRVTVSPGPETRDASAATQISMLGVPAGGLTGGTGSGSRQGGGASFVPSSPFAAGERVSVRAQLQTGGQAVPFAWSFIVATPDRAGEAGGNSTPRSDPSDYQSFHSRPDLRPPLVTVTVRSPAASAGDIFLAPYSGPGQYGPMILDESGQLVWFEPLSPSGTR